MSIEPETFAQCWPEGRASTHADHCWHYANTKPLSNALCEEQLYCCRCPSGMLLGDGDKLPTEKTHGGIPAPWRLPPEKAALVKWSPFAGEMHCDPEAVRYVRKYLMERRPGPFACQMGLCRGPSDGSDTYWCAAECGGANSVGEAPFVVILSPNKLAEAISSLPDDPYHRYTRHLSTCDACANGKPAEGDEDYICPEGLKLKEAWLALDVGRSDRQATKHLGSAALGRDGSVLPIPGARELSPERKKLLVDNFNKHTGANLGEDGMPAEKLAALAATPSLPPEPELPAETEFHRMVTQMVFQYTNACGDDSRKLATFAKAQAITSSVLRRLLNRQMLAGKHPRDYAPADITLLVREEDARDEKEGTGR